MIQKNNSAIRFDNLGIASKLLEIIQQNNFITPTPIQHQCIPIALQDKDIVGIAQTGTGKTLAFGLPMIQRLSFLKGQGLILLPTRELALQVDEVLNQVGRSFGLKTAVLIGGASMNQQIQSLRRNPHIIVATPGRMIDHLNQKIISLQNIKIIVLDEADRMLDIGFMPQIVEILKTAPKERQTMMFSATMPQSISTLATRFMKMPLRIEVAPAGTPAVNVEQEIFFTPKELKIALLEKILKENNGQVLVFSRTKYGAKRIANNLRNSGYQAVEIHSDRTLAQRRNAMDGFKSGRYRILVATDIAARGIDVNDIATVINYDLPGNSEDYVHRIGRTGRAGKSGKAISFATPDQRKDILQIERLIKKSIPVSALPPLQQANQGTKINMWQKEEKTNQRKRINKNDFFSFRRKKQNPKRKRYGIIN